MGSWSDINSRLTRKLGWYGAFLASGACLTLIACSVVALALRKSATDLLIPGLLGMAVLATAGPFFWLAGKYPHKIRIRWALGGISVLGLGGQSSIFYSALRLGVIDLETFRGLLITGLVCTPVLVIVSYFTIRAQLKDKKELV